MDAIYLYILVTIVLLSIIQFFVSVTWKKTLIGEKIFGTHANFHLLRFVFLILSIPLYIALIVFLKNLSTPHPLLFSQNTPSQDAVSTPLLGTSYYEIDRRHVKGLDNYYLMYTASDHSQAVLQQTAENIATMYCKTTCTLNFYDNLKAYQIDKERETITDTNIMEEWNRKNYVFVADHYLGYFTSGGNVAFSYYPYKDQYYNSKKK